MGAPWTQEQIQEKIDFYTGIIETIANSQSYSIEGRSLSRSSLADAEASLDKWIERMDRYYPDAFAVQPQIEFNEIGFISG